MSQQELWFDSVNDTLRPVVANKCEWKFELLVRRAFIFAIKSQPNNWEQTINSLLRDDFTRHSINKIVRVRARDGLNIAP